MNDIICEMMPAKDTSLYMKIISETFNQDLYTWLRMSDIGCEIIPSKEGYAMDWRGNSHDMDDLVVKIMKEGIKRK